MRALAFLLLVTSALALPASARAATEATRTDTDARAEHLGKLLRCPVCQGMPISESPSDMAQAMMQRVREMSAEGRTDNEILSYFTERYGEWVLLEPPAQGLTFLLWALPPVALLLGLWWVRHYSRRIAPVHEQKVAAAATAADPYLDAVRREVDS